MTTHPMSPVDAAWYHMDGPANLAMVTGIMLTKEPLDFKTVRAVYKRRWVGFDRFRQRVVERGFPMPIPQWEDMPNFDIDQHIHRIGLPAPHDRAALAAIINDIASSPLAAPRYGQGDSRGLNASASLSAHRGRQFR